jgi:predicted ribosome quality control (RQC) complex YloA/Tae2 family protein
MNNQTISKLAAELDAALRGRRFGRFFQISPLSFAADLRLSDSNFLLVSCEPAASRVHLASRRQRDLERGAPGAGIFLHSLKKHATGGTVVAVSKPSEDRVVRIDATSEDELGDSVSFAVVVQLTGSSANVFLLDGSDRIIERMRETSGEGQEPGHVYAPPRRPGGAAAEKPDEFGESVGATLSEAVDRFFRIRLEAAEWESTVRAARSKLDKDAARCRNLLKKLGDDLSSHGDAERWKRAGDLLLANISEAQRVDGGFVVTDYFDDAVPKVKIDTEEGDSLTEAAERFFRRYTKARNAAEQVAKRISAVEADLAALAFQREELERAVAARDRDLVAGFIGKPASKSRRSEKKPDPLRGVRRFVSSDGYEILVGKGSRDNDNLTFRIAKSLDLWLHAADYPGSHVVIRNQTRGDIPQPTLLQAAQLAAFYSDARGQGKAAVNYTSKKHVNKPRGAAPGLVSLSSFKTLLVVPAVPAEVSAS